MQQLSTILSRPYSHYYVLSRGATDGACKRTRRSWLVWIFPQLGAPIGEAAFVAWRAQLRCREVVTGQWKRWSGPGKAKRDLQMGGEGQATARSDKGPDSRQAKLSTGTGTLSVLVHHSTSSYFSGSTFKNKKKGHVSLATLANFFFFF
jgi:hypothetical protein